MPVPRAHAPHFVAVALVLAACGNESRREVPAAVPPIASPLRSSELNHAPPPTRLGAGPAAPSRPSIVLVAGGDVNLGRDIGQRILHEPSFDPFGDLRPLLAGADLAFANLESPLSDQNGETQDPVRPLVFVGPPRGAELVAHAPFHVVSVANNHVWDYGERGFLETLDALERARVRYAGASRTPGEQYRPAVLTVKGWSIALFAVTHVWNPGEFETHDAVDRVAWADAGVLAREIRRARAEHDLVLVSYHGGREYADTPAQEPLDVARAVMDAGADALLAHHPHVPQGIGWFGGRPAFYSLGNLVFGKHRDHAWTARGFVARLRITEHRSIEVAACAYLIEQGVPRRAANGAWPGWEDALRRYLRKSSSYAGVAGTEVGAADADGCLPVRPGDE